MGVNRNSFTAFRNIQMCNQNHSSFLLNETRSVGASSLQLHNKWEADGRSKPRTAHSRPSHKSLECFSHENSAVACGVWLVSARGFWEEAWNVLKDRAPVFHGSIPTTLKGVAKETFYGGPQGSVRMGLPVPETRHGLKSCTVSLASWLPDPWPRAQPIVCK